MGIDNAGKEYLEKRLEIAQRELMAEHAEAVTSNDFSMVAEKREERMFWKGASAAIDFLDILRKEVA